MPLYRGKKSSLVALGPKGADTPIVFHVADYGAEESEFRSAGFGFEREGAPQGVIWDPAGNVLRLHDRLRRSR
jgi:hypothetical protein